MPDFLEKKLAAKAKQKGFSGARKDKYVYGAMNNMGAMHGNKTTAKGKAMAKKHAADVKAGRAS